MLPTVVSEKKLRRRSKAVPSLPTQDELPSDDGVPMETERHKTQMDFLLNSLRPWVDERADGYLNGNMFIYFSAKQLRQQDFRGPDFFVVLGVPKGERKSWVVWEEGKGPDVVIELLSEATAKADKGEKKLIYQNQLRVAEYFWFDPFHPEDWAGFELVNGVYQSLIPDNQGGFFSRQLGLTLVQWQGEYNGIDTIWLRWANSNGELLLTAEESAMQLAQQAQRQATKAEQRAIEAEQQASEAEQQATKAEQRAIEAEQQATEAEQQASKAKQQVTKAKQQAKHSEQRATEAEQRAQRLAEKLRALGIDPTEE
jgi:Uma2 family endonuclease